MRGIVVRETLTDEWNKRGVKEQKEYAILTAEISKAAFGMTPSEYKKFKGLNRENLRDHMNDLELIFSMLGEASTTEIAINKNADGFEENKKVAKQGGDVAATLKANGGGLAVINSSSAIIFASSDPANFAQAAADKASETRDLINQYWEG